MSVTAYEQYLLENSDCTWNYCEDELNTACIKGRKLWHKSKWNEFIVGLALIGYSITIQVMLAHHGWYNSFHSWGVDILMGFIEISFR